MNILLLEDKSLLRIYKNFFDIIKDHNLKLIKKQSLSKIKSKYDMCFVIINSEKDLSAFNDKLKDIPILMFTENVDDKFIWKIIKNYNPIDIININIDINSIIKRVISNITMMEEGVYEKDN